MEEVLFTVKFPCQSDLAQPGQLGTRIPRHRMGPRAHSAWSLAQWLERACSQPQTALGTSSVMPLTVVSIFEGLARDVHVFFGSLRVMLLFVLRAQQVASMCREQNEEGCFFLLLFGRSKTRCYRQCKYSLESKYGCAYISTICSFSYSCKN